MQFGQLRDGLLLHCIRDFGVATLGVDLVDLGGTSEAAPNFKAE